MPPTSVSSGAEATVALVLIGLAVVLQPLPLPAEIKALIVAGGGVAGSFARFGFSSARRWGSPHPLTDHCSVLHPRKDGRAPIASSCRSKTDDPHAEALWQCA